MCMHTHTHIFYTCGVSKSPLLMGRVKPTITEVPVEGETCLPEGHIPAPASEDNRGVTEHDRFPFFAGGNEQPRLLRLKLSCQ